MEEHKVFEKIKLFLPNTIFHSFFQGTVFLYFTKLVAAIHCSMDTVFISERTCSHELCIYNAFDRYFYLRRIATSKEDLQPYIWVVPSLFQEGTFSDLVFSRVPSFFEISICNRLCFQRYWVNSLQLHSLPSIRRITLLLL